MKTRCAILILLASATAVQAAGLVWPTETKGIFVKKFGPPIETVETPDGFRVTPADVSAMFAPRTFKIMIYADDSHYFVTRYDRNQTLKKAQLLGVTINGKTGTIDKQGLGLKVVKSYGLLKKEKGNNLEQCLGSGGMEKQSNRTFKTLFSPKAKAFVASVEKEVSGFLFSVVHSGEAGRMPPGIAFVTQAPQRQNTGAMIIIGKEEALAITRYFARSGMLDKTDGMPAGMLSPGWSVHLGTENVSAYWYLGRQENALLKSTEVMGVRNMLGDKSRKRWDEFIRHVRESEFQSIDTREGEKQ